MTKILNNFPGLQSDETFDITFQPVEEEEEEEIETDAQFLESVIASRNELFEKSNAIVVACIDEEEFLMDPYCPHCYSVNPTIKLESVMSLEAHIVEMQMCTDCCQMILVCAMPTLFAIAFPVFLHIVRVEGAPASVTVVNSDVAKALLAQLNGEVALAKLDEGAMI